MKSLDKYKKLSISCPICQAKEVIDVPISIIDQSKHLTTISIPKGKVCKHHFQIFVDKNFAIRGFQKVDYELNKNNSNNQKLNVSDKMTLNEIYEEFWEYISEDNEHFRTFIIKDKRRKANSNINQNNRLLLNDLLPHVCKNLD